MSAMKESTATAVNMMVGISITTAEPTLVLKKVMVASQPLKGTTKELVTSHSSPIFTKLFGNTCNHWFILRGELPQGAAGEFKTGYEGRDMEQG